MKDSQISYNGEQTSKRTTKVILIGSLVATCTLLILLIIFNVIRHSIWLEGNSWIAIAVVAYLLTGIILLHRGLVTLVNWMLIAFYQLIAFATLLIWGLNAPVGILTICFAVILPSILMGSKSILPVVGVTVFILATVQVIHQSNSIKPAIEALSHPSTLWDVIVYSFILSIFALVSWIAGNQREKQLQRTLLAESELQKQKDNLSIELEKQSAELRLAQLTQVRELHKFAILGQSAAATLHELSNHLSVLNLDIDNLHEDDTPSKAIAKMNTKESIEHINKTVRQARHQLNTYDHSEQFNAVPVIKQIIKDLHPKFAQRKVELVRTSKLSRRKITLTGNPMALMQIISVVLNNALDACCGLERPKVTISMSETRKQLVISVADNGVGIDSAILPSLFQPIKSSKSSGMGVGLYIAQHLLKDQFNGTISLIPTPFGAQFNIILPKG